MLVAYFVGNFKASSSVIVTELSQDYTHVNVINEMSRFHTFHFLKLYLSVFHICLYLILTEKGEGQLLPSSPHTQKQEREQWIWQLSASPCPQSSECSICTHTPRIYQLKTDSGPKKKKKSYMLH